MNSATAHWPSMAECWKEIASPLRPSQEDCAIYQRHAREWMDHHGAPRVLLLGVTPELYRLAWEPGTEFLAVDFTAEMIERVWPGRPEEVRQMNWRELPLPACSRDLVLCDGGLQMLHPLGQRQLVARLREIVTPGGLCIVRLYVTPPAQETPDAVLANLMQGGIPNLNVLKLRLSMAMQASAETGIDVHEVRERLLNFAGDWGSLAAKLGWRLEHLKAIDAYAGSKACYHFSPRDEAERLFCDDGEFIYRGAQSGNYALSNRCPIVAFQRR